MITEAAGRAVGADPDGAAAIRAAVGTHGDGRPMGVLGDAELLRVIGNFPLTTLTAFPGLGISHDLVRTLAGTGGTRPSASGTVRGRTGDRDGGGR